MGQVNNWHSGTATEKRTASVLGRKGTRCSSCGTSLNSAQNSWGTCTSTLLNPRGFWWRTLGRSVAPSLRLQETKTDCCSFFDNFTCTVGDGEIIDSKWWLSSNKPVQCQRYSAMAIDCVMRHTRENAARGIRWTLFTTLEALADDRGLVSRTCQHIQEKITGQQVVQPKQDRINSTPVQVFREDLPMTEELTYLGSTVKRDKVAVSDIQNCLTSPESPLKCSTMWGDPPSTTSRLSWGSTRNCVQSTLWLLSRK